MDKGGLPGAPLECWGRLMAMRDIPPGMTLPVELLTVLLLLLSVQSGDYSSGL